MNSEEFATRIDRVNSINSRNAEYPVVIPIKRPWTTAGGTPFIEAVNINSGFDWDNGKIFIIPKEPLMLVSDYENGPATIKKLQSDLDWALLENRRLKAKIKKYEKENKNATESNIDR